MKNKQFLNFEAYENKLSELSQNPKIKVSAFGKSIMNKDLQKIEMGKGSKKIIVLGGVGGDSEESFSILSFVEEYIKMCEEGRRMCGTNPMYVLSYRSIIMYPLLNPDAFVYKTEGVGEDNPIRDRIIGMNKGNKDFSSWCANGRGVSLERNSSIGFELRKRYENANEIFNGSPDRFSGNMPESEPELCALLDDILKYRDIKLFVQISKGSEGIYSPECCEQMPGGIRILKSIRRISGLNRAKVEGAETGIVDSIAHRLGINSLKIMTDRIELKYMRDLLYSLPILV